MKPVRALLCLAAVTIAAALNLNAQVPRSKHVIVVNLENHSYESVIGNPAMPYLNSLASKYALATQYYATTHTSLTALMWLTAGAPVTYNDQSTATFNVDNIVRHIMPSGQTWKSYAEAMPYAGYLGLYSGPYYKRHNPLAYFSDVANSSGERLNLVPMVPNLKTDLAAGALPNYAWIVPDIDMDAHNGTLATADQWLQAHIPQVLANPQFQKDGIMFITWDEGDLKDSRHGGGRVATIVIGPRVKRGYKSTVFYNHQSLLRTTCLALGLNGCPGGGATGVPMRDFFTATSTMPTVTIQAPAAGTTTGSPVHVQAYASDKNPVTTMAVYIDYKLAYKSSGGKVDAYLTVASGAHTLTVNAWDTAGACFRATEKFTAR